MLIVADVDCVRCWLLLSVIVADDEGGWCWLMVMAAEMAVEMAVEMFVDGC